MIPETIGTIGNTQGVNARPSPATKKSPAATQRLEPVMMFAYQACSDTGITLPGEGGIAASSVTTLADGRRTLIARVIGG